MNRVVKENVNRRIPVLEAIRAITDQGGDVLAIGRESVEGGFAECWTTRNRCLQFSNPLFSHPGINTIDHAAWC